MDQEDRTVNLKQSIEYTMAELQREQSAFMSARTAELMADGLTNEEAAQEAADEWAGVAEAKAPGRCWECEFIGPEMRDPYGTGDSPTMRECKAYVCPWGKR